MGKAELHRRVVSCCCPDQSRDAAPGSGKYYRAGAGKLVEVRTGEGSWTEELTAGS
jgi:hypothetical protein